MTVSTYISNIYSYQQLNVEKMISLVYHPFAYLYRKIYNYDN